MKIQPNKVYGVFYRKGNKMVGPWNGLTDKTLQAAQFTQDDAKYYTKSKTQVMELTGWTPVKV